MFTPANIPTPPPPGTTNIGGSAFNTFKVEPRAASEPLDDEDFRLFRESNGYSQLPRSRSPTPPPPQSFIPNPNDRDNPDVIPHRLMKYFDSETNLIRGRSPEMVMYILMKAKFRFALEQHESLVKELRQIRHELKQEQEEKEVAVDRVLRHMFGWVVSALPFET